MNMRALIFSILTLVSIGAFAQTEHRKDSLKQEDMQKLKNIFDNGVTFWHNANTFLDYSQNNS